MWTPNSIAAFAKLKQALPSTQILALPDFSKQFAVKTDASGVNAMLTQEGHTIAYLSKTLSGPNLALSIYDKEMLAIVFAVQHWRPYLLRQHFRIITDHKLIKYFLKQHFTTPQQQKWLVKLLMYNYSVEYQLGSQNTVLDALSCKEELLPLLGISSPIFDCITKFKQFYATDPQVMNI